MLYCNFTEAQKAAISSKINRKETVYLLKLWS